jgi:hypothetical protein
MALWSGVGAEVDLPDDPTELFGEGPGRAVIAVPPGSEPDPSGTGVMLRPIGEVGGDAILGVALGGLLEGWRT